jgi:prepilin-type N-terminal cleavage/methylation domain-containing protein
MNNKGFTLIELMVVIVIMGLLLAIGTVQVTSMITLARIRGSADKITQEIQGARERAISRGAAIDLVFRLSSAGGCSLTAVYNTSPPQTISVPAFNDCRLGFISSRPGIAPPGATTLPSAVASNGIDFPSNTIRFLPQGVGTSGAVYIKSLSGKTQYAITVNANGRVEKNLWGGTGWN